jgi:hypothetical protein
MVTGPDVVYPGKADGVEFVDLDAVFVECLQVRLLQRLVVRVVAEAIEDGTHFYAFLPLLSEDVEEQSGNGVVPEIEILQVYATLRLADGLKHIGEFLLAGHQQSDLVASCELNTIFAHLSDDERITGFCMCKQ